VAVEEELVTIPVTVEDIDKKSRKLVVRTADGEKVTMNVPPNVKGFDNVKKGDKIDVDYYRSVAVAVLPGAGAGGSQTMRTTTSGSGSGGVSRQTTGTAEVVSVNRQDNSVQIKGPGGNVQSVAVQNPALQRKLQDVKPGDMVQITYTEAVAAAIRPSRSSK
jgi:type III secretory pathway component EscU